MGAPDLKSEGGSGWWKTCSQTLKVAGSNVTKVKETSEFGVALGSKEFVSGQHEFEFSITRLNEGYVYIGVAVPWLALEQTFCRKDANDQVWYYFGCGYTNALRNGWNDVVSKEVGGPEMKIPKLFNGDKVRVMLDMDAGHLRFALYRPEYGIWKELPGQIENIKGPVVAACCLQERLDAVSLSDSARADGLKDDARKRVPAADKYAHVQSKLAVVPSRKPLLGDLAGAEPISIPLATKIEKTAQRGDKSDRGFERVASNPVGPSNNARSIAVPINKSRSAKELFSLKPNHTNNNSAAIVPTAVPTAAAAVAASPAQEALDVEAARGPDGAREAVVENDDGDRSSVEPDVAGKNKPSASWDRMPLSARHGGGGGGGEAGTSGSSHQNSPRDGGVVKRSPESILPQVAPPPPHRLRMPNIAGSMSQSGAGPGGGGGGRASNQSSRGPMKENCSIAHAREAVNKLTSGGPAGAGAAGTAAAAAAAAAVVRQRSNSAESVLRATHHDQLHYGRERLYPDAPQGAGGAPSMIGKLALRGDNAARLASAAAAAGGGGGRSSGGMAGAVGVVGAGGGSGGGTGGGGGGGGGGLQSVVEQSREELSLSLQGHNRFQPVGAFLAGPKQEIRRRKQPVILPG